MHILDSWQADIETKCRLMSSILETLPDMIFLKDAGPLRFVYMNAAGGTLLGYRPEEFIGKTDYDFFPHDIADYFTSQDRETLRQGRLIEILQEPIVTKTGDLRYLQTKKVPLCDDQGRPTYLLGISRDITEHIRLRREVAELGIREQERIAADLHDTLGQTLTGLAIKAKVLEDCLARGATLPAEEVRKIIWMANHASEQARAIARGMDPVVLKEGLIAVLNDLAATTRENCNIACTFVPRVKRGVSCDKHSASHLFRIAQEAVNNAIRHGHAEHITIQLDHDDEQLVLSVKDDGNGLDENANYQPGRGLSNMNHRAHLIGAVLELKPNKDRGATVICRQRKQDANRTGPDSP